MQYSQRLISIVLVVLSAAAIGFAQNSIPNLSAQAANVTEFDVNGLKVILKRRESAPTVSAGLFLRGGVRNMTRRRRASRT